MPSSATPRTAERFAGVYPGPGGETNRIDTDGYWIPSMQIIFKTAPFIGHQKAARQSYVFPARVSDPVCASPNIILA